MEGIHISLQEVSKSAGALRAINEDMHQQLLEMRKVMNQLAASWQSPASETIRTKFNGMMPIFENYKAIVESYAKFLDHTVVTYETLEANINTNAGSFQ